MMRKFSLIVIVLVLCGAVEKGKYVIELDNNSFKELVLDRVDSDFFLVEFYDPICGACKNFATEYAKIGDYLRGIMKVGRISIKPEEHKPIANEYKVTVVPHVILFLPNNNNIPEHFEGSARTPVAILKWILSYFSLLHLDPISISSYLCSDDDKEVYPTRFLLVHNGNTLGAYTALAETKSGEAFFGEVDVPDLGEVISVGSSVNLTSYPVLVVHKALHGQGERYVVYETNWQDSLKEFWEDIDAEVLETLQRRKPILSIEGFSILFLILAMCMVGVYTFCQSKNLVKNVSELTNVSWGDSKVD